MKVDIDTAEHFRTKFHSGEHLKLGRDTLVNVASLEVETEPPSCTESEKGVASYLTVTATVRLQARVSICIHRDGCCHVCGARPSLPSTYDALWHILENHDGERLVFPAAGENIEKLDRDDYPVPGWLSVGGKMTCVDCARDLEAAKVEIGKRRKAGR